MRICHVNLASGFSGGERQTLQLIKQQVQEGYQLTVVANPKSPFVDEIRKLPCQLVLASHFTKQHAKSITEGCKAIHVHEGRAIYWALIQHLLYQIPYIVTRRIDNPLKNKWLSNLAYKKASALVGLSSEIVDKIKIRHPDATVYKIPSSPVSYPINTGIVSEIKTQYPNKCLVIHGANMLKHKGFDVTLGAARILASTNPDIHFVLLGDGPERASLEALSTDLGNITFAGKQSNMGDWFAAADLLVHPSYSEGLGSVILEAIGARLPVIATHAGGIPDIIDDGESGLLIPPGNASALAENIARLANDKALREHLISGGAAKLQQFDIVYTSDLYQNIYNSIQSKDS